MRLFALSLATAVSLAACSSSGQTSASAPSPPASSSPTAILIDDHAVSMCTHLRKAAALRAGPQSEPEDGFTVGVEQIDAVTATLQARVLALKTEVTAIQEIVGDGTTDFTPDQLELWCRSNNFWP